ncbi:MAG: cytochrome c3 family protein [Deltaproteobacteria bacterium]|nr:cytochrome c3 family protein [Deltaproteobacteria bacterium]
MGTLYRLILFILVLPFFLPGMAFAQKASAVTCTACHKTAAKILPESHKGYNMKTTALCFNCHKVEGNAKPLGEKIHAVHLQKSPEMMKNCFVCHQADKAGEVSFPSRPAMKAQKDQMGKLSPFFSSWTGSSFLDNRHRQRGLYCLGCHSDYVDEYTADDTQAACVKCHGDYPEMIKKTSKTKYSHNPHQSHYVDLKCSACHQGHKEFKDYCAQCHSFGYKTPK